MDKKFYDVNFSPIGKENEIERGEKGSYGYIIGEEESGTVLFIFHDLDVVLIPVFGGAHATELAGRTLEISRKDGQIIFCYKYGRTESLENVKSDLAAFTDALWKKEREFIEYCMTHD